MRETRESIERRLRWYRDLETWQVGDMRELPPDPPNVQVADPMLWLLQEALYWIARGLRWCRGTNQAKP